MGLENLYFKLENINPSGSYKDRFAAMVVSRLLEKQVGFCLATSSGNTGAALAAYCAAAGIRCFLVVVDGAPQGKLLQMQAYGASTLMVKNFGKDPNVSTEVMESLASLATAAGTSVHISAFCYSPVAMQGVQTIAYELAEKLDRAQVFVPAGGGGLTLAVCRGFDRWQEHRGQKLNFQVYCVQPEGNNSISGALSAGHDQAELLASCTSSISGLQVPNVLDGNEVITACRASGGTGFAVPDDLIYQCQEEMAQKEGIFCEPAGSTALAGLKQAILQGKIDKKEPVICLVTGHGFKDPTSATKIAGKADNQFIQNPELLWEYLNTHI